MTQPSSSIFPLLRTGLRTCKPTPSLHYNPTRTISTYGYTQAKALVYSKHGEPKDVLSLHTHSIGPPHSNLITLRTLATPLNPADINQIQGTYASLPPLTTALGTPQPSAVPGNEACFEVLSTGSGVRSVAKGDWVICAQTGLGTYRTHLQIPEDKIIKVDKDGLEKKQVAAVGVNPVTAWRLLKDFGAKEGEWVVLNGANSGVGRAVLQLAKMWGIRTIAVVRDREGEEGVRLRKEMEDIGATMVVSETDVLGREFSAMVKEWTNDGRERLGLALNCVGGKPAVALAKVLSPGGRLVTYGAMSKQPMVLPAGMMIFRDVRFEGFWVSRWGDEHPEEKRRTVEELLRLMREKRFRDTPVVEVGWGWDTGRETLVEAVQGTLEGFRRGKGMFVFEDM